MPKRATLGRMSNTTSELQSTIDKQLRRRKVTPKPQEPSSPETPPADEGDEFDAPFFTPRYPMFQMLAESINLLLDDEERHTVKSHRVRDGESPPSAVWHVTIDNKQYVLLLQPTDMPDRRSRR